jgi:hypothetical protein
MMDEKLSVDSRLLGRWISDPTERVSGREVTSLEFLDDGSLTYTIHGSDKNQVMLRRFRTDGETIVSDQESSPREERTPYSFTDDGKLMLLHGADLSTYVRAD